MTDGPDPAASQPRDEDARRDEGLDLARTIARGLAGRTRRLPRRSKGGAGGSYEARRNEPGRASGAHPDERDPQLLEAALDRLLAERGWQTDAAVGGAIGRWGAIVGAEVAAHCEPLSFDKGELVVQADSTAWATQVRLLVPVLLRRLNEDLGAGTVASVRVLGPGSPSWKRGRLSVRGRGPRDTYG
jgi:predicted nucleic acid-binding Zn ribbon protein